MRDEDIYINQKKHVIYSKEVKEVVKRHLLKNYPEREAMLIWEKTQNTYVKFLKDQPAISDRKNPQMQGVYDSILLFAYYDSFPRRMPLTEFETICNDFFVPYYEKVKWADVNKPFLFKIGKKLTAYTAKQNSRTWEDFPHNYHMVMEDSPSDMIKYKFTSCPIADFAARHHFLFLMPAMCNPDYKMLSCVHAGLIRTSTVAKDGEYCDYLIVGDKNPIMKKHPLKKDEHGYLYNE